MSTSKFQPTDEQGAIMAAVADPAGGSLMVEAGAGTAKSTTLQLAAPGIRVPALALAFNRAIAQELQPKLTSNFSVKTFNGLGYGAWMRANPQVARWELDDRKLGKLVSQVAKDRKVSLSSEQWDSTRRLVSAAMVAGLSPGDQGEPLAPDLPETWAEIADGLWIAPDDAEFLADIAREVLERDIALAREGKISFDDQVYCATILGGQFPRYPVLFTDESQDLSALNHQMVRKSLRDDGRLVAVGDPRQCHPPGTMIQLSYGKSKRIEEIEIGDKTVSFNRKVGFSGITTQGNSVVDKREFHFEGELVRINTDGPYSHDCTPNHKCMVRWTNKTGYSLYLMRKGSQYRIGIAQNWYNAVNGGFGPAMRARQEHADALWVLEVFDSKEAAQIAEKVIWTRFGLPDLIFRCSGRMSSTQAHLDAAWKEIGNNEARALACLKHYRRLIEFPIWTKENKIHIGEKTFITQACNLVNFAMEAKVYDGSAKCETWLSLWVDYVPYSGPVYGITVGTNGYGLHLYVANGIVTHNSIYGFRGADHNSMNNMRKIKQNWKELELTLTFRCPRAIVARQLEHYPSYRAAAGNPEGIFHRIIRPDEAAESWGGWSIPELRKLHPEGRSLAVLCRNNAPLLSLAFKLIRGGTGVQFLGRDIGKGLQALSKKLLPDDSTPAAGCVVAITDWSEHEQSLARANGKEEKLAGIVDRAESLLACLEGSGARSAGELRAVIEKLFERSVGQVVLATGHKAKGLEWDIVVHLDPWRIPSKFAKRQAQEGDLRQLRQEYNLRYVIETRTRFALVNANLEDFNG